MTVMRRSVLVLLRRSPSDLAKLVRLSTKKTFFRPNTLCPVSRKEVQLDPLIHHLSGLSPMSVTLLLDRHNLGGVMSSLSPIGLFSILSSIGSVCDGWSPELTVLLLTLVVSRRGSRHTACSNLDLGLSGHKSCLDLVLPDKVISTVLCLDDGLSGDPGLESLPKPFDPFCPF